MPPARRFATAALAAVTVRTLQRSSSELPAPVTAALARTNHRGEPVTLAEGPAVALAATLAAAVLAATSRPAARTESATRTGSPARTAAAAAIAGLGAATVGAYDDIVGARPEQRKDKGFAGHLRALREGRVSAGAVKVAGVGVSGLLAGQLLSSGRGDRRSALGAAVDTALAATVVAGAANVVNLLDLRPGRALKASLLLAAPLLVGDDRDAAGTVAAAVTGAALAALPDDLGERSMLGDAGANALGALLGVAAAARLGRPGRALVAAGLIGLMAASERVSFTAVIARTPALNAVDMWGRRPVAPAGAESGQGTGAGPDAAPTGRVPEARPTGGAEPGPGAGRR